MPKLSRQGEYETASLGKKVLKQILNDKKELVMKEIVAVNFSSKGIQLWLSIQNLRSRILNLQADANVIGC